MQPTIRLLCWIMLPGLFLAACSPAVTPLPPTFSTAEIPTSTSRPVETPQPEPAATSRGDELEASDPALVKYGDGRPVLIEFFRFT
jgi:hypothetical protein